MGKRTCVVQELNCKVAGIILACGQSRRMGVDKAFLVFKGKTFIGTVQNLLNRLMRYNNIFISGRAVKQYIPDYCCQYGLLSRIYSSLSYDIQQNFMYAIFFY